MRLHRGTTVLSGVIYSMVIYIRTMIERVGKNMKISISDEVYAVCPGAALGVLSYQASVAPSTQELFTLFDAAVAALSENYSTEKIAQNPHIAAAADPCRAGHYGESHSSCRFIY
ncbi:hypothetical protein DSY1122 [Desulfitobacterium hafniense Y51]|uniref:Uncharacterized protein n=3 Tax=Desulfitobacterium hafniense TaxID=49338 RepID=Q24YI1_DESHY|nr:hypothetical protein DSY1122 [Desulfitobacterium hafniense Y51]